MEYCSTLKKGDLVTLNSGGGLMEIVEVIGYLTRCVWHGGENANRRPITIPTPILVKVNLAPESVE
jgi:uncharacterized protein YodC (DUF2158 family)